MLFCAMPAGLIAAADLTFDVRIEQGRVPQNMRRIRVEQGDAVRLRWTTDRPIVVHLHGYDIQKTVEPGKATEMTFTAHATGRFPVEEHEPNARGGHSHGEAALLRIEVHPR
ncbi:MAG: hypothetical protein KJZ80_07340 [Hyphomicrobiaceae bacterium]|nr:hypothetical protein [Hyphomicrobiaceae bacterium]